MSVEHLVVELTQRLGVDRDLAERALRATVEAVAPSIQPDDRHAWSAALPRALHDALADARYVGPLTEAAIYDGVARRVPTTLGHAREITQAALRLLADPVGPELRARLARHAEPSAAWLWTQAPRPDPPLGRARAAPPAGRGHTLASGRPGGRHPLADAGPLGHTDSIARSSDPKADRKLSSARGTTSEQTHRTLAEGHPGSEHAISEERD